MGHPSIERVPGRCGLREEEGRMKGKRVWIALGAILGLATAAADARGDGITVFPVDGATGTRTGINAPGVYIEFPGAPRTKPNITGDTADFETVPSNGNTVVKVPGRKF